MGGDEDLPSELAPPGPRAGAVGSPWDKAAVSESLSVILSHSLQATSSAFLLLLPLFPLAWLLLNYFPVCAAFLPMAVHSSGAVPLFSVTFVVISDPSVFPSPKVLAIVRQNALARADTLIFHKRPLRLKVFHCRRVLQLCCGGMCNSRVQEKEGVPWLEHCRIYQEGMFGMREDKNSVRGEILLAEVGGAAHAAGWRNPYNTQSCSRLKSGFDKHLSGRQVRAQVPHCCVWLWVCSLPPALEALQLPGGGAELQLQSDLMAPAHATDQLKPAGHRAWSRTGH
ncbi:hypothetical protein EK904_003965 [Melospiza melodia maxima]|nr:hypothetical protein EK904_003965 [Melospiza melodia maxima]